MNKPFLFSTSLIALALALRAEEDKLLIPLDLERVVIRGEARRLPSELGAKKSDALGSAVEAPRRLSEADEESEEIKVNNTLRLEGGGDNYRDAFESLLLQRRRSSLGLVLHGNRDDGYRQGYDSEHNYVQTEWSQRTGRHMHMRTRYSYSRRDFELPDAENMVYAGAERDERIHDLHLQLESPWTQQKQFRFFVDHTHAGQVNSQAENYRYRLYRVGAIYDAYPWESALSLDTEDKGSEDTSLMRLFVKRSHNILDEKTTLHLGVGAYVLSSRESRVDNSGYFSLVNEEKDRGMTFSPYVQLDHQLSKKLVFTTAYTQFYESLPFVETFYNQPEHLRPSNLPIQPTFNVQIESGLRWDLNEQWKSSVSYAWHKYQDRPITVMDLPSGKLTKELWTKGEEQNWQAHLLGNFDELWDVDFSVLRRYSEWENFNLDFTPYKPKWEFGLRGDRHFGKWKTGLEFQLQVDRQSYPVVVDLGDRPLWNAEVEWNPWTAIFLNARCENIFDNRSYINIGYPDSPLRAFLGLRVKF